MTGTDQAAHRTGRDIPPAGTTAPKVGPRRLFGRLGHLEAVTWALLLLGMFAKYVTETTELGVRVFGMVHGVVFIAYCVVAVLVGIDQRWRFGRLALALISAVVPFMTVWLTLRAERNGWLAGRWRLRVESPAGLPERLTSAVVRKPLVGAVAVLVLVAALTALALLVGPPGA
jgi:integral membrane protein